MGAITVVAILNSNSREINQVKINNLTRTSESNNLDVPNEHIFIKRIAQTDKYLAILSLTGGSFSNNDLLELKHVIRVLFNSLGDNPRY
ncbi:MAG: hypothetical protein ACFFBD_12860 [Candidatus Hodarchaeota archaeon]